MPASAVPTTEFAFTKLQVRSLFAGTEGNDTRQLRRRVNTTYGWSKANLAVRCQSQVKVIRFPFTPESGNRVYRGSGNRRQMHLRSEASVAGCPSSSRPIPPASREPHTMRDSQLLEPHLVRLCCLNHHRLILGRTGGFREASNPIPRSPELRFCEFRG